MEIVRVGRLIFVQRLHSCDLKNLELVDKNAGPYFYNIAATEWLTQRLETMSAAVLSFSAFVMALHPPGTLFSAGEKLSPHRQSVKITARPSFHSCI
jgi:hypothetical protein